jgi:type VI secretion system Hcp family effector
VAITFGAFQLNGTDLTGDVTVSSIGGVDVSTGHIEIHALTFGSRLLIPEGQGLRAASRRTNLPVRLTKRTDRTTPLLYRGLRQNARLDGDIRIFDTDPDTGETRHRFTLRLGQARITSVESHVPDAFDVGGPARPPVDVVELVPHTIGYIDEVHSVEFEDTFEGR